MTKYKIQFGNVWRWFVDQATHPKTFFNKESWGVFSVYAHIRRSDRLPKKSADTKIQAQKTADFMSKKYGGSYSVYKCVYCDDWHIAKDSGVEAPQSATLFKPMLDVPATVDVEMMQKLDIPDFAAVYGGVRGRGRRDTCFCRLPDDFATGYSISDIKTSKSGVHETSYYGCRKNSNAVYEGR